MRKRVSAGFHAIEDMHVGVIDRVHFRQPSETGVDRALIPSEDIRLVPGVDLVTGLVEARPKEVANVVHDGFLEDLKSSDIDGGGDQAGAHDLRVQELLPRPPHVVVHALLSGVANPALSGAPPAIDQQTS